MGITSAEPDRTTALVLEAMGAPQIVGLARDSTDIQILAVDPEAAADTWFGRLPPAPAKVVADVRAVRALLADEAGRSWLAQVSELSLALPVGEEPGLLLPTATDLETLGLRAEHVEYLTTTIAVLLRPSAGQVVDAAPLAEQVVEAFVRAAAEASLSADALDQARRDAALAVAQPRAGIEPEAAPTPRPGGPRPKRGRWARAVRHPLIATRRVLGRAKRLLS